MQADSELEPPQTSTSAATTPISATKRKFGYRQGLPLHERISAAERRRHPIETSFVRCSMLSALVKGLACRECSEPTLKIRAIDRRLGLVYLFETYCTTCGAVLNSTLSSDRIDKEKAGNVPFVVVRQAVAADMGVGHAGLVKLEPLQHKSYSRHVKAVTAAVAEFNSGVEVTMQRLCDTMGIASGERLIASAKKADRKRLHEAERQAEASTKTMRQARRTTRAASAEASASDYAAGEF